MPPRLLCPIILAFWFGMMFWLFQRDIWPRLAPGEPPPFSLFVADEKRRSSRFPTSNWIAKRTGPSGNTEEYRILIFSRYDTDEKYYEYRARWEPGKSGAAEKRLFQLGRHISNYRIHDDGSLREFDVEVQMEPGLGGVPAQKATFLGRIEGRVCNLEWNRGTDRNTKDGTEPFAVSHHGVVLLPLHPLESMRDIRAGQKWGVPAFDPLGHSGVLSPTPVSTWVNAHVRSEPVAYAWKGRKHSCLVVDYEAKGESLSGSTWVDAGDDQVLFMEVNLGDDRWEIRRE